MDLNRSAWIRFVINSNTMKILNFTFVLAKVMPIFLYAKNFTSWRNKKKPSCLLHLPESSEELATPILALEAISGEVGHQWKCSIVCCGWIQNYRTNQRGKKLLGHQVYWETMGESIRVFLKWVGAPLCHG